ncbi:hypothetical protein COU15_03375 [Candidatus Kaiserbacteria bacterium CG10_big_fil_rev_8_21_14_0_10_45_20]|uniref:Uncharacterized protein n=1 Tax=Candidatus Kaiserbacteria bacterium CG10_big_fil_rev_8_21_14_0_10_45_20 TaxID=1974607 RepID=A0A2H0UGN3_9BACT|nr:MAG: hypothetical protein COU15_03375 [Candidatus Kaiserbacteria bacterium CG10_big_fil_rev_8_21_14_0_10_45_20]
MPNNTARFFIPRPAEDGSVIYLPAFCIFNVQGERSRQVVHRSNLLVEQSADTIEDADGHLAINLRNNPVVRWFEINERRRTVREVQSIPGGQ